MKKEEFTILYNKSTSMSNLCSLLSYQSNGTGYRKVRKLLKEFNLPEKKNITNFIYPIEDKVCPVCDKTFKASIGSPTEKQTCSYSCSNTHFRSGEDNPNYKDGNKNSYRTKALKHYKHKCSVCAEEDILDVHHIDEDRTNGNLNNLIILCPTHHMCYHRGRGDKLICKI